MATSSQIGGVVKEKVTNETILPTNCYPRSVEDAYSRPIDEDPQTMMNNFQRMTTEYREKMPRAPPSQIRNNRISNSYDDEPMTTMSDVKNDTTTNEKPTSYDSYLRKYSKENNDWSRPAAEDDMRSRRKSSSRSEFDSAESGNASGRDQTAKKDMSTDDCSSRHSRDHRSDYRRPPRAEERSSKAHDSDQFGGDAAKARSNFERLRRPPPSKDAGGEESHKNTATKAGEEPDSFINFKDSRKPSRESISRYKENVPPSGGSRGDQNNNVSRKTNDPKKPNDEFRPKNLPFRRNHSPTRNDTMAKNDVTARNDVTVVPDTMNIKPRNSVRDFWLPIRCGWGCTDHRDVKNIDSYR